jgi:hypothetical protein
MEELRANLDAFIDRYYNARRLHSALGCKSLDEFERQAELSPTSEIHRGPRMSFSRHEEIYPSDVRP